MAGRGEVGVPVSRPGGVTALLVPAPVAAILGLAIGLDPHAVLVVAAAAASAVMLVLRVDWAALALIVTTVFEGYLAALSPWAIEWVGAVLVVAWVVRRAAGPLHGRRLRRVALPGVLLLVAAGVAFVAHPHGRPGVVTVATYAGFVVVMLVLADCLCGPLPPRRAARAYVLSCVAASVCGLLTAITDGSRVAGPIENADTLAFFLLAALPLVGTVRSSSGQPEWWVWACTGVLVVAGVGTQSRPAFLALVVMLAAAVAGGLLALRYAGALLAVVTTGVALIIALWPLPVGQALTDAQRAADTTIAQRNEARGVAWRMTVSEPVLGLGPAAFALFRGDYVDHAEHLHAADSAARHSAYSTLLQGSAELGLLGGAALYAVWLVPAAGAWRRRRHTRSRLGAQVMLALVGLLVVSLMEWQAFTLPLWLLSALAIASSRPPRPRLSLATAGLDRRSSGQVVPGS